MPHDWLDVFLYKTPEVEFYVIALRLKGESCPDIADSLDRKHKTIKNHEVSFRQRFNPPVSGSTTRLSYGLNDTQKTTH